MSENKTNETAATEQELSELLQIRRDKLKTLQEEGRDPFTQTRFARSAYSDEIKADFDALDGKTVKVAGRIMSKRGMGKAIFCHIKDDHGSIQLYIRKDAVSSRSLPTSASMISAISSVFRALFSRPRQKRYPSTSKP